MSTCSSSFDNLNACHQPAIITQSTDPGCAIFVMKSEVAVDGALIVRKGRASKGVTEAYYFILALAWNEIITIGTEMAASEQEDFIKSKGAEWANVLLHEYSHVPLKPDVTLDVLNEEISTDNGNGMIRKAKEMTCYITNVLNPVWNETDVPLEDALSECRKVAWLRNEEDRKRKRKLLPPYEKADRPYDTAWRSKEWLAFRYLGLPAGKNKCLQIFQCGALSGPFAVKKYCLKRNLPQESECLQLKSTNSTSSDALHYKSGQDTRSNIPASESSDKVHGIKEILPSKQFLWREEKERLESLVKLSEQLKMPAEVNRAHLLDLYNFLLTPPVTVKDDADERRSKTQKTEYGLTPTSAEKFVSTSDILTTKCMDGSHDDAN